MVKSPKEKSINNRRPYAWLV